MAPLFLAGPQEGPSHRNSRVAVRARQGFFSPEAALALAATRGANDANVFAADADGKSDCDNFILFAGYYRDSETGLCHVRNRYHHPQLGWLTCDPARQGDAVASPAGYVGGMSLYEYA